MENNKKWIGVALGALVLGGAFAAGMPSAHAQNAPRLGGDNYYWANGEKVPLGGSSWIGVQVKPNNSTAILNGLNSERALDNGRGSLRYGQQNLLFVPVDPKASAAQQNALRARLESSPRVEKTVRTFGEGSSPMVDSGEINVRFKSGVKGAALQQTLAAYGASIVRPLGGLVSNGYVVRVGDKYSAIAAANGLYESGATVFSQPNFLRQWQKRDVIPASAMAKTAKSAAKSVKAQSKSSYDKRLELNDPLLPRQWHLNNTGQGGGTPGADISAFRAWDITKGDPSVVIAILDDGVDLAHEDFAGKLVPGFDFVDGDNDPSPATDEDDHGTACAGVAAAQGDNAIGVSGSAPDCLIMPIRVLGGFVTDASLADAFRFAANNGADVLSNSFGPPDGFNQPQPISDTIKAGIDYAAVRGRGGKGSVILFAAGNGNENADFDGLASYFRVISVAASTNFDTKAFYSDFGSTVDISAPSNGGSLAITTVDRTGDKGYSPTNYTNTFGGTSSATPLAAGVAALILSVEPTLTNVQVQQRLEDSADKISPGTGQYDSNGHSPFFGFGRVNAYAALLGNPPKTTLVSPADGAALSGTTVLRATTINDKQVKSLTFDYRRLYGSARRENLNIPIPDFDFEGVSAEATIEGTPRNLPVQATVTAQIQHSFVGDLRVTLISPGGQEEVIYDHNNGDDKFLDLNVTLPVANRPLSGTYKLRVVDDVQEDTGTILNFGIDLTGEYNTIGTIDGTDHIDGTAWTLPFDVSKLPSGQYQVRATALSTLGRTFSDINTNISITGTSAATYVLSGKIVNREGAPLGNVAVTLTTGSSGNNVLQTTRTNARGEYTFNPTVTSGVYTITPSLSGIVFSPSSRTFTVTTANIPNINFTVGVRDTTRPTLAVKTPEANQVVRSLVGISGTAADNTGGSGIDKVTAQVYRFATRTTPAAFLNANKEFKASTPSSEREVVASGTTNFALRLPALADGRYATRVTAVDKAGNKTSSAVLYFTVDSAPPVVTIVSPTNGATLVANTAPTLGGTVGDNSGGLQSLTAQLFRDASGGATAGYFNGREFVRTATPIELTLPIAAAFRLNAGALQSGRYRLIVTATDKVGNKAAATSIFTVRPSVAPPSVPRP